MYKYNYYRIYISISIPPTQGLHTFALLDTAKVSPPLPPVPLKIWPLFYSKFIPQPQPQPQPLPSKDLDEPWAPVWKPVEESPQFFIIQRYLRELELEKYDHIDDSLFPTVVLHGHTYTPKDDLNRLKRFLKQVRESRGYDVDNDYPRSVLRGIPFHPIPVDIVIQAHPEFEWLNTVSNFVVTKINAEKHGNMYEFHEIEKWVDVDYRYTMLTISVKEVALNAGIVKTVQAMLLDNTCPNFELLEWRFKPQSHFNLS